MYYFFGLDLLHLRCVCVGCRWVFVAFDGGL